MLDVVHNTAINISEPSLTLTHLAGCSDINVMNDASSEEVNLDIPMDADLAKPAISSASSVTELGENMKLERTKTAQMKEVLVPSNHESTSMHLIDSSTDKSSAPFPVAGLKEARPPLNKVSKLSDEHITFSTVKRKGKPRHTGVKLWILKISNMFEILSGEGEAETNKNDNEKAIHVFNEPKPAQPSVVGIRPTQPNTAPTTSTPSRTSSRKKVSLAEIPSTPYTSDPDGAKKLSFDELRVKISKLNMAMDKAMEEKDSLKVHETKQAIRKLEVEIKEVDAAINYAIVETTVESTPKVTQTATSRNSRNVSIVTTTGIDNETPSMFKKLTSGQLAKQEKLKRKKEALEKEKELLQI